MALFNEILAGRLNLTLRKLLNMKGEAPAPQVGGDIVAGIILENDRPEWKYLGGELMAWAPAQKTGAAGNYSHLVLLNPSGSGVICVVEELLISNPDAAAVGFWIMENSSTTVSGNYYGRARDQRFVNKNPSQRASCQVASFNDPAIQGYYCGFIRIQAGSNGRVQPGAVLYPGQRIMAVPNAQNTSVEWTAFWRERQFEASET